MQIKDFEDIIAWQKARILTNRIYKIFENHKDFGFNNQIQRSSVSIMNNIAEGFERRSNNEFKYFLNVSKGSTGEVRSMLYLAVDLEKLNKEEFKELYNLTIDISRLLSGFIKSLK